MIHEDAIPFLVLAVLAVTAGILGKHRDANVALALFCAAGFIPLLAYASNAERWPISSTFELGGFFAAVPLILLGSLIVGRNHAKLNARMVGFWLAAASALCAAVYLSAMVVGRGRIPV